MNDETPIPTETGYSNVGLRVRPDGTVYNVFPGGIEIPLPTNSPDTIDEERIQWKRASDDAVVAQITGFGPGYSGLELEALGVDALAGAGAVLKVLALSSPAQGGGGRGGGPGAIGGEIGMQFAGPSGSFYRYLMNATKRSHFLQVADGATPALWAIDFGFEGVATFTNSGPNETTEGVITHRLGRQPLAIFAHPLDGPIRFNCTYQGPNWVDNTEAELAFQLNSGAQAGGDLNFAWLAVG